MLSLFANTPHPHSAAAIAAVLTSPPPPPPHTTTLPPSACVPSQIRTVDLGPFKHRIDDGLELRKAAFECLDILLASLPHVLQVGAALGVCVWGVRVW